MSCPVDVTKTCNVALARLLVASTRRLRLAVSYSAREIVTVSAAVVAALTVSVAERAAPFNDAVILAVVAVETCDVLTVKFADDAPAATVTPVGTVAAPLLLAN